MHVCAWEAYGWTRTANHAAICDFLALSAPWALKLDTKVKKEVQGTRITPFTWEIRGRPNSWDSFSDFLGRLKRSC